MKNNDSLYQLLACPGLGRVLYLLELPSGGRYRGADGSM